MSILVNENKGPSQPRPTAASSAEVAVIVYVLEVVTKIGKNFPVLFLSLASLNTLLAANDFLSNNLEFGILNSMFAASGFVFVLQLHQNNKDQFEYQDYKLEELGE